MPELKSWRPGLCLLMRLTLLLILLQGSILLSAQTSDQPSLFDSLYSQKGIRLILSYPFDSLYRQQNDKIAAKATLITDEGAMMSSEEIAIHLRGKFRRMKCTMPPLMLNFRKTTLRRLGLNEVDEIKLVTHCIDGPEGSQNVEEEHLLYQVYETITPLSYRTIWLQVSYCDEANPDSCIHNVAFLLEPDKVVAQRLGVDEEKRFNIHQDSLDVLSYGLVAAYNFLIGNRDWSITASRNAKLFYNPSIQKYCVIPYDFDYANVVAASYRRELPAGKTDHPFDRIYEGEYFKDQESDFLKSFLSYKDMVLNALQAARNPVDVGRRNIIKKYFEHWFSLIRKTEAEELQYGFICPHKGQL